MKGIVLFGLVCIAACSNQADRQAYIDDADRYCEVHKESYWEETGKLEALNQLNGMEKQIELAKEIRSSVKTSEMQALIYEKGASVPAEEFYPYLQEAIPKLTGKPYDCPAILEFYLPTYHEGY
jgi:hypothetical protein